MNVQVSPRVAVVLNGCGVYDGTEITEAVSTLVHLTANNCTINSFAPNVVQHHVINHTTGEEQASPRNVLEESARIVRGNVQPLDELTADDYDAVIFPGGFGAAKNLSTYAFQGESMTVNDQVQRVLTQFKDQKKPIGLMCISPVLAAKVFGDSIKLTVGVEGDSAKHVTAMGATHVAKAGNEILVDTEARVVTAPAYMDAQASYSSVFDNVGMLVDQVVRMTQSVDKE